MGVDVHGFYTQINVRRGPLGGLPWRCSQTIFLEMFSVASKSVSSTESVAMLSDYCEVLFDCNDVESLVKFFFYWSLSICAMAPFKLGLISCVNTSSPCGTMHTAVSLGRSNELPSSQRLSQLFCWYQSRFLTAFDPPCQNKSFVWTF